MDIELLSTEMEGCWNDYVMGHKDGTAFHLVAWKNAMERIYPYKAHYTLACEGGRIRGVLPLFKVERFGVKQSLLSLPFAIYGGPLTDSVVVLNGFRDFLVDLARHEEYRYIEIRNRSSEQNVWYPQTNEYITFRKDGLNKEMDVFNQLPQKTRNLVRKAQKAKLKYRICSGISKDFLALMALTFKRHGTPCFSDAHFISLADEFGKIIDVREIVYRDTVIAASLNIYFKRQMHCYYAVSNPRYWSLAPNVYMYYKHLCWAKNNGFVIFEFGRSRHNSGAYHFKRKWGAQKKTLPYELYSPQDLNLYGYWNKGIFIRASVEIWKRLPLLVTKSLGPKIVVFFP